MAQEAFSRFAIFFILAPNGAQMGSQLFTLAVFNGKQADSPLYPPFLIISLKLFFILLLIFNHLQTHQQICNTTLVLILLILIKHRSSNALSCHSKTCASWGIKFPKESVLKIIEKVLLSPFE